MLQSGGLPSGTTATRVLSHLAGLYAAPAPVDELSLRLGVDRFARTPVRRLSGGQRQRLALVAALVGRPEVVFLDEPTAGLDPHGRLDVYELLDGVRNAGTTVVVTTHSFEEAERLADHLVIVSGGRTVAEGTPAEVVGPATLEEVYFGLTRRRAS
jgi:ABC-2 type transport system ATP-binding protein